jgi:pimeloyl-ACP methyl ester carboxylesterase
MLSVILEFIDKVVGKGRFVVGGTSAGAYLARGVVRNRQSSVDGLLLVVPLIVTEDGKRTVPSHVVLVEEQDVAVDLEGGEAEAFGLAVVQSHRLLERLRSDVAMVEAVGDGEFQQRIRGHTERYAFSFEVDELVEPFRGPTLIVTGRQDAVVGYRDAWKIVENFPRGTYVVMDRAGHLLEIEQESLLLRIYP